MPGRSRHRKITRADFTKPPALLKVATGIAGFDEITGGGLPAGRPTLVCGGPGCGKTLFGLEFLVHGAARGESCVFVTFEETEEDILKNVASLGYDVADLVKRKRLALEYIRVERAEIEETGEYDLEGLFIRLDHAIRSIDARRIVLDTIESLFAGLSNAGILRAEPRRLFAWLKQRGITAVVTGEHGADTLTRQGLEEYVSDCVIVLDHRITEQISTRRLRVVKYRGSSHGTNEYPFLIDRRGIMLLEDHADSREFLVQALRNSGAAVTALGAARDAFAALERVRPCVIIVDIGLPDEDGYAFIRRVRAHSTPAIQSVPALAVTAYTTTQDRAEALAVGFQQHLPKPIDPQRLVQAIQELARRSA